MSERICGYVVPSELHMGRSSVVYRARRRGRRSERRADALYLLLQSCAIPS